MRGLNRIFLLGNATRDTELRKTRSGVAVSNMRLATNRTVKNRDGGKEDLTEYHTVICFGRLAETTAEFVVKGKPVFVEGRLITRTYKDRDGNERETTEVLAQDVQFLGNATGNWKAGAVETKQAEGREADEMSPEEIPF